MFNNELSDLHLEPASLDSLQPPALDRRRRRPTGGWADPDSPPWMPTEKFVAHLTTIMLGTIQGIADPLTSTLTRTCHCAAPRPGNEPAHALNTTRCVKSVCQTPGVVFSCQAKIRAETGFSRNRMGFQVSNRVKLVDRASAIGTGSRTRGRRGVWDRLTGNSGLPEKVPVSNDIPSRNTLTPTPRSNHHAAFTGLTLLDTIQGTVGAISSHPLTRRDSARAGGADQHAFMESVQESFRSNIFHAVLQHSDRRGFPLVGGRIRTCSARRTSSRSTTAVTIRQAQGGFHPVGKFPVLLPASTCRCTGRAGPSSPTPPT